MKEVLRVASRFELICDELAAKGVDITSAMGDGQSLEMKHRIKMTIPIIPFVLWYENELQLTRDLGLSSLWNKLMEAISW